MRVGGGLDLIYDAGPAYSFSSGGTIHGITDFAPAEIQVMVSWWLPATVLSQQLEVALDMEVAEELYLNAPNGAYAPSTTLRPGIRVALPESALFVRAALPIHLETPVPYDSGRSTYNLRFGLGLSVPLVGRKSAVYVEADLDESLGGGKQSPGAFSVWHVWLNAGVDLRF